MAVTIDIHPEKIVLKVESAWNEAMTPLAQEILDDCNQYCKEDSGALIASSYIHSELSKGRLIWQTPYAKRQYWAIPTSLTPGRVWKWCHYAMSRHKAQWERQAQILLRGKL